MKKLSQADQTSTKRHLKVDLWVEKLGLCPSRCLCWASVALALFASFVVNLKQAFFEAVCTGFSIASQGRLFFLTTPFHFWTSLPE